MKIQKKNNIFGKNRGVISLIAFLSLGIFLLLGTYFLSLGLTETKITKSEEISAKTYYLAESGINEAIWKLENDETARNNFLNGTLNETMVLSGKMFSGTAKRDIQFLWLAQPRGRLI